MTPNSGQDSALAALVNRHYTSQVAISKSEPFAHTASTPPLPKMLGRYEVIDRIAIGGMAEIFVCCERGMAGLQRLVVVKRILPHLAVHHAFVEMFLAEARHTARLNHPNVVGVLELQQDENGAPFLAMEYVPGSSVRDVLVAAIGQQRPTPVGAAVSMIAQACAGAHAAHELLDANGKPLGLVHRDISPHNLIVTSDGHTKLLDFGIAKATEVAELEDSTRTGALKGKVHYMSPEQCRQAPLDRRSDVFALGIVLWEALAQERLFKRNSELDTMHAIINGDVKDLGALRTDVSAELLAVLNTALAPARDDRYASADLMRRALLEACRTSDIACGVDDAAKFVAPLLGDAQRQRAADLLAQAQDRTRATPGTDDVARATDEPTLVGKKRGASAALVVPASVASPHAAATPKNNVVTADKVSRVRSWVASIGVVAVAVLAAVLWFATRDVALTGAPLVLGLAPAADASMIAADAEPLRLFLQARLHAPVEVRVAKTYDDLQRMLLTREADVAALPPYLYTDTKTKEPAVRIVATKIAEGSVGTDSILYVHDGAEAIADLAGLKGKRFCFPDTKSTTGYLFPRLALKRAGIDPDRDVVSHLSGSHMQSLRDLVDGVCDAAATYSSAYLAADRAGVQVGRVRQLAFLGRSPNDAVTLRTGLNAERQQAIVDAFLAYRPADGGSSAKMERVSGFRVATDADYDAVREALKVSQ